MSGTGWVRTAPPKPKLAASDNSITAAANAAAASAVPVNCYSDAAKRAIVAQGHADKEVKHMMTTSIDQLEVLRPKDERPTGGEPVKRKPGRTHHDPESAAPVAPPAAPSTSEAATELNTQVSASEGTESPSGATISIQCQRVLLDLAPALEADPDVIAYLANLWSEAEDLEEVSALVAETLEAHGVASSTIAEVLHCWRAKVS